MKRNETPRRSYSLRKKKTANTNDTVVQEKKIVKKTTSQRKVIQEATSAHTNIVGEKSQDIANPSNQSQVLSQIRNRFIN